MQEPARISRAQHQHAARRSLPTPPTPLIGRAQEVQAVCALLQRPEVRLLTLLGTAGVGKTRLALQVAAALSEAFADGILFVSLSALSDPALVIPTIAERLGLRETGPLPILTLLESALPARDMVLVLDNFEQVIAAAPSLAELLEGCPELKLLVTSREALHLRAEHQFLVPPLALPTLPRQEARHALDVEALEENPAVQLFLRRAQTAQPAFQVTPANAATLAEICKRLDGLPLAIELAAPRLKLLSSQALLERLEGRLQVLVGGARDLPERQRTMRATLTWSYELLSPAEQALFRRLALFANGWRLAAAEQVAQAAGVLELDLLEGLESLLDKSLLRQEPDSDGETRFRMLYVLREFGLEKLAEAGELAATRAAHAVSFLSLAEEAEPHLVVAEQKIWMERLEQEHDNLRAALEWFLEQDGAGSSHEMALRLCGALWQFWSVRGLFSEGRTELSRALAGSEGVVASVRAKALSAAADLAYLQSDDDEAEALSQESLNLYREVGDTRGIASSLSRLAWVATRRGNFAAARSLLEEGLRLNREVGDKDAIAWSLFFLADNASIQGEYTGGQALFEESLEMFRELGNKRGMATALKQWAVWLFVAQGDQAIVRARLEDSLALFGELGDKGGIAFYSWASGWVALSQGDSVTAQNLVEQSLTLWRELGNRWYTALSLGMLGKIAAQRGDLGEARALHEESLAIARASNDNWLTALCLEALAAVVTAQGEVVWAARLWGAAESLRDTTGSPLPPVFRADYERSVAATRTQLGEKTCAAAWAEGRSMTPEQVLAAATADPEAPTRSGGGPPTRTPVSKRVPEGLTPRELEVLRLLVALEGPTNRQMAEQLGIEEQTVHAHLRSIYSKLGVSNRSAATSYAIKHRLV